MTDPIALPLDDEDRLAEPPLLDYFHEDSSDGGSYVITFVPRDTVSPEPTESVRILKSAPEQQSDVHRIATFLSRIEKLAGSPINRIAHDGGGNYSLLFRDDSSHTLADFDHEIAHEIFDRLKQIAEVAEFAFTDMHHRSGR